MPVLCVWMPREQVLFLGWKRIRSANEGLCAPFVRGLLLRWWLCLAYVLPGKKTSWSASSKLSACWGGRERYTASGAFRTGRKRGIFEMNQMALCHHSHRGKCRMPERTNNNLFKQICRRDSDLTENFFDTRGKEDLLCKSQAAVSAEWS